MFLTEERAQALTEYLGQDSDRAEELSKMPVEKAVAAINADGYDFTVDELKEFSEMVAKVSAAQNADDELDDEALESISGGGGFWVRIKVFGKEILKFHFTW